MDINHRISTMDTTKALKTVKTEAKSDVPISSNAQLQTIEGFGGCFNELGWTSLNSLAASDKEDIFKELFALGKGANFTVSRMPVRANDFSRDWYSHDETEGDFELKNFSIRNDSETLIPFIHHASKRIQFLPDLSQLYLDCCGPGDIHRQISGSGNGKTESRDHVWHDGTPQ